LEYLLIPKKFGQKIQNYELKPSFCGNLKARSKLWYT